MKASILVVLTIAAAVAAINFDEQLERDEIIEAVNSAGTTWKAGRNFHPSLKRSYLRHLVDLEKRPKRDLLPRYVPTEDILSLEVPSKFDARKYWSECSTISQIMDEGPCNAGYALAPTMVFQDRLCIATNATFNSYLSVQQTLTCCDYCYDGDGCSGGDDLFVWDYLIGTGTCTGGPHKSKIGCQPYTIPECNHNFDSISSPHGLKNCSSYGNGTGVVTAPSCKSKCYNKNYDDHTFADDFYSLDSAYTMFSDVLEIQKEMYANGPLETYFDVYEDFLSYKSGVYQHTTGDLYGSRNVRVIGWGVEDGTKYWLAANSWNTDWGDDGLFKIKRGDNECGFEDNFAAGLPEV